MRRGRFPHARCGAEETSPRALPESGRGSDGILVGCVSDPEQDRHVLIATTAHGGGIEIVRPSAGDEPRITPESRRPQSFDRAP